MDTQTRNRSADDRLDGSRRAVWRWHFYAGLIVAPILVLLAITGALYLFDREIDDWWNRKLNTVPVGSIAQPLAAQEHAVIAAFPDARIRQVKPPRTAGEASRWMLALPDGARRLVFVDPYRAEVTGSVDPAQQPMSVVLGLHGTLMAGDAGSYVIELAACWTLVMIVTGIYLWWPRRWRLAGVFVPRLSLRGRGFWRDLHAIPAMAVSLGVMFLVLSGLPWSVFWGAQFAKLGAHAPFIAPSPNFSAGPKRASAPDGIAPEAPQTAHQHDEAEGLPWAVRNSPVPSGSGAAGVGIADIEAQLTALDTATYGPGVRIFYPRSDRGVFMISYVPDKAEGQRTIYIDPGDGRILGNVGWDQYSPVAKIVEWGVLTHMGRQYGLANQIANLALCIALVGAIVAGVTLWWRRRPRGALGAPRLNPGDRLPGAITAMIAVIAIVFPLVGLTLAPVLIMERLRRRSAAV